MNDSQTNDKLVKWAMAVLCHDSRILSEKGGEVDEEDALKRCFGERGCFMERPEKGCRRESRESMPQVKGLKELTLPVWQQQKKAAVRDSKDFIGRYLMAARFFYRIMTDMEIFKYNGVTYNAGYRPV